MAKKLPPLTERMLAEALEAQYPQPRQRSWGMMFLPAMTILFSILFCISSLTPGWEPGTPIEFLVVTIVWFVLSALTFKYT